MTAAIPTLNISQSAKAGVRAGHVISGLTAAFFGLDSIMKFAKPAPVVDALVHGGWPIALAPVLGAVLLACTVLYAIPRTSVLGAILLTGYLGGAVATNLRVGDPLFGHVLFPTYFGVLIWGALFLRDPRLRALISLRTDRSS